MISSPIWAAPWFASSCLAPGSFEDEAPFRVDAADVAPPPLPDASPDVVRPDSGAPDADGSVTRPDGGLEPDMVQPPTGETIWIEAESATVSGPLVVQDDAAASGGKFITAPVADRNDAPDSTTDGIATYPFSVTEQGTFTIYGRIRAPTTDNDSFWVKVDQGVWIQWNNLPGVDWTWDDVHDSGQADARVTFTLGAGDHTLSVTYREQMAGLDKLVITSDPNLVPMGLGQ